MRTWTGCAGVRVFRVTWVTNYRAMSGDCETLLSPAAVIKAIRDKFPTRALYSMAQTRHPANKGVIKTVIGNRDSWVTTSWRAFSLRLRPPWTCLLRPDSLSLTRHAALCTWNKKNGQKFGDESAIPGPGPTTGARESGNMVITRR